MVLVYNELTLQSYVLNLEDLVWSILQV